MAQQPVKIKIGVDVDDARLPLLWRNLEKTAAAAKQLENASAFGRTRAGVESISSSLDRLQKLFIGVQLAQAAFASTSKITNLSDGYAGLIGRLKLATSNSNELAAAQSGIFRIAQSTQAPLEATGQLYTRLAVGMRALGASQAATLEVTEATALALKISGASAEESGSAMLQLSQAFATGTLRGEEFNAVNEAAPRLMKALADSMGVPVGALKKLAEEGKITSGELAKALTGSLAKLREEARSLPQTVGGAMQQVENSFQQFLGTSEKVGGGTALIVKGLKAVADNVPGIASAAVIAGIGAFALVVGKGAAAMTTAGTAAVGLRVALAFLGGPIGLVVAGVTALSAGWLAFGKAAKSVSPDLDELIKRKKELEKKGDIVPGGPGAAELLEKYRLDYQMLVVQSERLNREAQTGTDRQKAAAAAMADRVKEARQALESEVALQAAAAKTQALDREGLQKREKETVESIAKMVKAIKDGNAEILKSDKEVREAKIKDQEKLVDAVRRAMEASVQAAKDARDKQKEILETAADKKQSREDQLTGKRIAALPEEDQAAAKSRQVVNVTDEADILAARALLAALAGDAKAAEKFADDALKRAEQAASLADALPNPEESARRLQAISEIEQQAFKTKADLQAKAAAEAEKLAAGQAETLKKLEAELANLRSANVALEIKVSIEQAEGALKAIRAELAALPERKTIDVVVNTTQSTLASSATTGLGTNSVSGPITPMQNAAGGLIRGPGSDTSDNLLSWLSPNEFVVRAKAVRHYGADLFAALNALRLPRFADGGLVSRLRIPQLAGGRSGSALAPAVFNFPGLGSFPVSASPDVLGGLKTAFSREALRKGRR